MAGGNCSAVGKMDYDAGCSGTLVVAWSIIFNVVICAAGVEDGNMRVGGVRGWM